MDPLLSSSPAPRGCGGIGRRARFRSVWGKPRGGSSPLIRIPVGGQLGADVTPRATVNGRDRCDDLTEREQPRPGRRMSAGTLLSVNVGMPKDVSWRGKTVFTGVFKEPVSGPRRVRRLNVDGDGQGDLGGHGGEQRAVF